MWLGISFFFLLHYAFGLPGLSDANEVYETAYACEESILNITCQHNLNLNIIRANFGRFSIAICNPNGVTDYSVNCMSPRTLRVIRSRCQGQRGCEVPVDSRIFGDPCPNTRKYVEVHYSCSAEVTTSTTSRPRPPWFPENPPNSWADLAPSSSSTPASTSTTSNPDDDDPEDSENEHDYAAETGDKVIKVKVPKPYPPAQPVLAVIQSDRRQRPLPPNTKDIDGGRNDIIPNNNNILNNNHNNPGIVVSNYTHYCGPVTARGLFWNWTRSGDTAVLECPGGSVGFAKWRCGRDPVDWTSLSPSLAECQSKWLNNLDSRLRDGESIRTVSGDLAQLSGLQPLYGGDLRLATKMLKHMAERMNYDIQVIQELVERESMVTELVQNVVVTASNVLDRLNHVSWSDLSADDVAGAATALMIGLEENAFLLAHSVSTEKIIIKPTNNILLSIRVMQTRTTVSQRFPSVEHLDMWRSQEDSITLSAATLTDNAENGAVRIIFAAYNEFDELLVPTQRPNSTLRFINSKVISASLGKGKHVELREPVKITLKHLRTVNVSNPVCVFWNYTSKVWSWDGCWLVASNLTHSQCECDHLTNFALMMDEGQGEVAVALAAVTDHITTIIACVATLVCVTVLMFAVVLTWRRFRVSNQCRSMLQKSGIPCFHKTKELSEKDKKQGNFYTVTPKMNGSMSEGGRAEANIEMNTEQQYFQHMIAMQKNQDTLGLNKASTAAARRNTMSSPPSTNDQQQETNLSEADLKKNTSIPEHNLNPHTRQSLTLNARRTLRQKTGCEHAGAATLQFGVHNDIIFPKKNNNIGRAKSPFNHIYMEIDKAEEGAAVYEALNQSERSETYMLSSVSDMSDEDFRRCSRQSSNRYAENKPLIRQNNLLSTISGVMGPQPPQQQMLGGVKSQPQHTHRTSILSTISGLRYTDPSQPGQPSLNLATGEPIVTLQNGEIIHGLNLNGEPIHTLNLTEDQIQALNLEALPSFMPAAEVGGGTEAAAPLQVTTVNGNQFLCLNLAAEDPAAANNTYVSAGDLPYSSFSDTYIQGSELRPPGGSELRGFNTASFVNQESVQPGHIQTPVHSQLVIQRVGTLPRQYAHPLAQI